MLWTRTSKRRSGGRRPASARRLHMESLEDRTLLAVAAFDINLYEAQAGTPGELIVNERVEVGDEFFVEIMARDFHPWTGGLGAVALDIAWNPDVLEVVENSFDLRTVITPNLPALQQGTLDNAAGAIDDLSGMAILSSNLGRAIGNWAPERFALLHFRALAPAADSTISMHEGSSRIVTVPTATFSSAQLDFETQKITVVARPANADPIVSPDFLEGSGFVNDAVTNVASAPQIEVSAAASGPVTGTPITTPVTDSVSISDTPLVPPAAPDDNKLIDETSSGEAPLPSNEIEVAAPEVSVDHAPTSHHDISVVVGSGHTQHVGIANRASSPNVCSAALDQFTNGSFVPVSVSRSVPHAVVATNWFIGPLPWSELARQLVFARRTDEPARQASRSLLDDQLVNLLAADVTFP